MEVALAARCSRRQAFGASCLAFVLAELAAQPFAIEPGGVPLFAPASGVALVAVLLFGVTGLAGTTLGAFLSALAVPSDVALHGDPGTAGVFAGAVALQAVCGAAWIRRRRATPLALELPREVVAFVVLGGPASCALGATLAVAGLAGLEGLAGAALVGAWFVWWIGASLGVVLLGPLLLRFCAPPVALWRRRRAAFLVPPLLAIVATLIAFRVIGVREDRRIHDDFERTAQTVFLGLQKNLDSYVDILHALAGLFESSEFVTGDEFRSFVGRVMPRYGGIRALAWAPVVLAAERKRFEQEIEGLGLRRIGAEAPELAPPAPSYVPIRYVEPARYRSTSLGLDLGSEATRRALLEAAARSAKAQASGRLRLFEGDSGVLAVLPVRAAPGEGSPAAPFARARGFIVAAIDPAAMREGIFDEGLATSIVDVASQTDLYRDPGFSEDGAWHRASYPFASRRWDFRFGPTPLYLSRTRTLYPAAVLTGGLALSGVLLGFLLILTGRTYRIELEVRDRTRELDQANRTLRMTVDELRASNQDLEEFAFVVSHDMREPLRAIAGFNQLLLRRYADEIDKRGVEWIHSSLEGAYRLERLLDAVRSYAHAGTRAVKYQTVDLDRAFAAVCHELRPLIEDTGAEVTADALPSVEGDAERLPMLLRRLIDNAIRYRSGAPPRVHVNGIRDDGAWVVSVRDNGVGVPPELRERIFHVFRRFESVRSGSGVGLAFCRRVVERRGGRIWLDPAPGGGSIFSFTIPDDPPERRHGEASPS